MSDDIRKALEEFICIDDDSGLFAREGHGSELVIALDAARAALAKTEASEPVGQADAYLCKAWGETDLSCAVVARSREEVRQFYISEWLGSENARDASGDLILPALMGEFDERDWGEPDAIEYEFEIGGVSVERVYTVSLATPPAAEHPAQESAPASGAVHQWRSKLTHSAWADAQSLEDFEGKPDIYETRTLYTSPPAAEARQFNDATLAQIAAVKLHALAEAQPADRDEEIRQHIEQETARNRATMQRDSRAARSAAPAEAVVLPLSKEPAATFQQRVSPWLNACFGETIARDTKERNHRFLEESLELVQATGCTASEAHQLVDYVFGRLLGDPEQEVGGVMVTLAALCLANGFDMHDAGETELSRIWTKVEQIRAKQAAKPKHSPLPAHPQEAAKLSPQADAPVRPTPPPGRVIRENDYLLRPIKDDES